LDYSIQHENCETFFITKSKFEFEGKAKNWSRFMLGILKLACLQEIIKTVFVLKHSSFCQNELNCTKS
jgi:hypothetical protein